MAWLRPANHQTQLTVEIKSTFWEKLFILPISLLLCGVGIGSFLVPFVPALRTTSRTGQMTHFGPLDASMAIALGIFMFAFGFCLWWAIIKYSIRVDSDGMSQTNGFFSQSVRWTDVASYYREPNRQSYSERRFHVEPVLLDAEGKIIFRRFAPILVPTEKIQEQRHQLWRLVESQLEGKQVEAPSLELDPEYIARRSLDVNWSQKSLLWKIARLVGLLCYALLWFVFSIGPLYYFASNNISIPSPWGALLFSLTFMGPLLLHAIWLEMKKRKIAREMKNQSIAE